jgi:anti-sigma factor RsiW
MTMLNNELEQDTQIKSMLKTQADYHVAPADLRMQIAALAVPTSQATFLSTLSTWFSAQIKPIATGFAMGAIVTAIFTAQLMSGQAEKQAVFLSLLADHEHAIVAENTLEVQSSNMHTVKPWLSSKLGYSPEIMDLADQGFSLDGGRRGFIGNSPVAVAVYRYKQHVIDVYILTTTAYQSLPSTLASKNGFNVEAWRNNDLHYIAVSDMNDKLLLSFTQRLAKQQAEL